MELRNLIITLTLCLFFMPINVYAAELHSNETAVNKIVQEDFSEYMDNIHERLHTLWQPPDFMEEGHVKVYFKLDKKGNLYNPTIIETSGNDIYDESALYAIKKAAPFAEFPPNSAKEYIAIKYSFDTNLIEEERMKGYFELAKANTLRNPEIALEYLNKAIAEVGGEEASGFLYKRRADIKKQLGDFEGAQTDYEKYRLFTERSNIKRLHLLKHLSETQNSAYIYHYLAYAYEQVDDIENALNSINKAIELSDADTEGDLKRYKKYLEKKSFEITKAD